jgi:hypothetical protein
VPVELIEWQPVVHQRGANGFGGGAWQATWEVTNSSKCKYLVQRLRAIGTAPEPALHHLDSLLTRSEDLAESAADERLQVAPEPAGWPHPTVPTCTLLRSQRVEFTSILSVLNSRAYCVR